MLSSFEICTRRIRFRWYFYSFNKNGLNSESLAPPLPQFCMVNGKIAKSCWIARDGPVCEIRRRWFPRAGRFNFLPRCKVHPHCEWGKHALMRCESPEAPCTCYQRSTKVQDCVDHFCSLVPCPLPFQTLWKSERTNRLSWSGYSNPMCWVHFRFSLPLKTYSALIIA